MKHKTSMLVSLMMSIAFVLSACETVSNNANTTNSASDTPQTEAESNNATETERTDQNENKTQQLKMTLDGNEVVTATFVEGAATEEFIAQLPFTVTMSEHMNRQKEIYLPFSLTEENLQKTVYEYEIGDIVYWHLGPTMGIFHDHDGRSISAGIEILARLDVGGVEVFASYPGDVEVTFELETNSDNSPSNNGEPQGERQLNITLDGTQTLTATLIDSPAVEEFLTQLPITLNMTDYINREKHAPLSFSISEENLQNIQKDYEIGDIIYYPPGPTFAMYYAHDGNIISAGFELIARLDQESIDILATYPNAVEVTIELGD